MMICGASPGRRDNCVAINWEIHENASTVWAIMADIIGLKVSGYTFEGPFHSTDALKNESGVYGILTNQDGTWKLLDFGESSYVRHEVEDSPRRDCWRQHAVEGIAFVAKYCAEKGRRMIVEEIRQEHSLPCGHS